MLRIGLVGEAPSDTKSIQNLLEKKYIPSKFEFFFMLNGLNGDQLEAQSTKRRLRIEYEFELPDFVVFIRDLDSVLPNEHKLSQRKEYFSSLRSVVNQKSIFLLNIYEIEALILADIEVFNELYQVEIPRISKPEEVEEPKEYLRERAKGYIESYNPEVFKQIRFEKALRCPSFAKFIKAFDKTIISLS